MKSLRYSISVIVLTYNPSWTKLKQTILSIIMQDVVDFEIIISDDGSNENYFDKIIELFTKQRFEHYVLINSDVNTGIVKNLQRAVDKSRGEYIKTISPGDMLYSKSVLQEWMDFVVSNNIIASFGKAVYYNDDIKFIILRHRSVPKYIDGYRGLGDKDIRKEYLLLDDMALGAAYLTQKQYLKKYLKKIEDKVFLGEDFMYTLMVFDGIQLKLFDKNVILYEFGHGVSTSGNIRFTNLMLQDWESMHTLMIESDKRDIFSKRFKFYILLYNLLKYKLLKRLVKYIVLPEVIWWRLKVSKSKEFTDVNCDLSFLNLIFKIENI